MTWPHHCQRFGLAFRLSLKESLLVSIKSYNLPLWLWVDPTWDGSTSFVLNYILALSIFHSKKDWHDFFLSDSPFSARFQIAAQSFLFYFCLHIFFDFHAQIYIYILFFLFLPSPSARSFFVKDVRCFQFWACSQFSLSLSLYVHIYLSNLHCSQ